MGGALRVTGPRLSVGVFFKSLISYQDSATLNEWQMNGTGEVNTRRPSQSCS